MKTIKSICGKWAVGILTGFSVFLAVGLIYAGTIDLPKTGQTISYYPGDDGDIRAGVSWPSPRFTGHGDGTVTDNLTGLMWTKDANLPGSSKTWLEALEYVAVMNAGTHQNFGYTDWRLPNVNEIESLTNAGVADTGTWLMTQGFSNVQSDFYYWSSTTNAWFIGDAWVFAMWSKWGGYLLTRYMQTQAKNSALYTYVWPVRSGQSGSLANAEIWKTGQTVSYALWDDGSLKTGVAWPSPRFHDQSNGTVIDNLTGLIWTKNARTPGPTSCNPDTIKRWQEALDYVACLNTSRYLGYADWRLPNRKDLLSLVDRSKYDPVLPAGHPFIYVETWDYWSSTTDASDTGRAWSVSMGHGDTDSGDKLAYLYVWPARGGIPDISVAPTSINFGNVNVGSTSTLTATVRNDGTGNLVIASVTSPLPPFGKQSDTCSGQTLSAGATCIITYQYSPTSEGTFSSNSNIPSNDPDENPVTVNLTGTGVSETVSTPSIPIGPRSGTTGTSYSYSTGGSSSSLGHSVEYQFDWKGDGSDLSSWDSSSQSKTWSAAGAYSVRARARCKTDTSVVSSWSGTLSVNITSNPMLTVLKSGTGSGTVTSSPGGINCGNDCSAAYTPGKKVTLTAKTDTNSIFTGWSGGGCSGTGKCVVTMNTDTSVTAAFSAKTPDISVSPGSLDFGSVKVWKKATKTLKITNNGSGDLFITISGIGGTDFSIKGSSSITIKARKTYNLNVIFKPTSTGLKTATLRITSNDPDTPTLDLPLRGTGQ
jgi:hypothetical protein